MPVGRRVDREHRLVQPELRHRRDLRESEIGADLQDRLDLGIVFLMTGFGLVGHICIIKAFSLAEVGSIAPFEYTGVIWAVLFGFFLWGDIPTPNVVTGAAFVVGAGLYIIYRDVRPRRNKPPLDIPNLEPTIGQRPTVKSTQVNS